MQATTLNELTIRTWQESVCPEACGDLVFTVTTGDVTRLVVADGCGHGQAAFELAARFRDIVRTDLRQPLDTVVFERWNRALHGILPSGTFVAATVIEYFHTRATVRVWNAANPQPLLLRAASGAVESLGEFGMPIGLLPAGMYESPVPTDYRVGPDDRLLAFTDGVLDPRCGDTRFGDHEFERTVADTVAWGDDVVRALNISMERFLQGQDRMDDLTVVQLQPVHSLDRVRPAVPTKPILAWSSR